MQNVSRLTLSLASLGLGLAAAACTVPGAVNEYLGIAGDTYEGTCSKLLVGYDDATAQCTNRVIRTGAQGGAVVYSFTLANGTAYPLYLNRARADGNGVTTYALTSRQEDRAGGGVGTCRETLSSTAGSLDLVCTTPANPQTGAPAATVAAFSGRIVPKYYPGAATGAGNPSAPSNSGVGSVR